MPDKRWLFWVASPLFFGAFIYWTSRIDSPPIFFRWLKIPAAPFDLSPYIPNLLLSSLPSFCWVFSMTFALQFIWQPINRKEQIGLSSIAFGVGVLFEALQYWGIFSGTFDWWDVAFSGLAALLSTIIFRSCLKTS